MKRNWMTALLRIILKLIRIIFVLLILLAVLVPPLPSMAPLQYAHAKGKERVGKGVVILMTDGGVREGIWMGKRAHEDGGMVHMIRDEHGYDFEVRSNDFRKLFWQKPTFLLREEALKYYQDKNYHV